VTIGSLLPPRTRKWAVWFLLTLVLAIASPARQKATVAPASHGDKSSPLELVFSVDSARSSLHWTLDTTLHVVHGTFAVKRGEVVIDPATGNATGEIIADATSGKTDNDSRDKKMHQEILETARFPEIVFRLSHVEGLATPLNKSRLKLNGTFTIHGTQHDMIVPADIECAGEHWTGTAAFVVPYIAWGIKNPSNFLLKASPTVDVTMELAGDARPSKAP
jgi:polyisoprenoid-binding protein YceI